MRTLILLSIFTVAFASFSTESSKIALNSVEIDIQETPSLHKTLLFASSAEQYLVKFSGVTVPADTRKQLELLNIKLDRYVPYNTYIIACTSDEIRIVSTMRGVVWAGRYQAEYKLSPSFKNDLLVHPLPGRRSRDLGVTYASAKIMTVVLSVEIQQRMPMDVVAEVKNKLGMVFTPDVMANIAVEVVAKSGEYPSKLHVVMPADTGADKIMLASQMVSTVPAVSYIEPLPRNEFHNYYSHGIMQSGVDPVNKTFDSFAPFFAKGIKGSGEIVGVGDTGIDVNNCFFYDAEHAVKYYYSFDEEVEPSDHRKIAGYIVFADDQDYAGGHGTHTTGTVAGWMDLAVNETHKFRMFHGNAPEARLAFLDMGLGDGFYAPYNMEDYFDLTYRMGARVHSSSWGSSQREYGVASQETDEYLYYHQDLTSLFSAGNDGEEGHMTIGSPSNAKNVISVGASQTTWNGFNFYENHKNVDEMFKMVNDTICTDPEMFGYYDVFCAAVNATVPCVEEVIAFCKTFTPQECCKYDMIKDYCCPDFNQDVINHPEHFDLENLASFSSRGPTPDGRIKPDILCPGSQIWSANSHGNTTEETKNMCGEDTKTPESAILAMEGTSMSCPTCAGGIALLRQYLRDGYLHDGTPSPAHAIPNPPASLLKALAVNGAKQIIGMVKQYGKYWVQLNTTHVPNSEQGYGRILLTETVPHMNSAKPNFRVLIARNSSSPSVSEEAQVIVTRMQPKQNSLAMCFKVMGTESPVTVTMAYTDYPADPSARLILVADLDLLVFRNGHKVHRNYTNAQVEDRFNNVEHLHQDAVVNDVYQIYVSAVNMPELPEPGISYSAVASGSIEAIECPKECPVTCQHNGTCVDGVCVCPEGSFGFDCGLKHCPDDCSGNGLCMYEIGKCFCAPGFVGDNCAEEDHCPNHCGAAEDKGVCQYNHCVCFDNWFGDNCTAPVCSGMTVIMGSSGVVTTARDPSANVGEPYGCSFVIEPMEQGTMYTAIDIDFTLFKMSEETAVVVYTLSEDVDHSEPREIWSGTGEVEPFTLSAEGILGLFITVEGPAPAVGEEGFHANFTGRNPKPRVVLDLDPTNLRPDHTEFSLSIFGIDICSASDALKYRTDLNLTIGGVVAHINNAACTTKFGEIDLAVHHTFAVGKYEAVLCSRAHNRCFHQADALTIAPLSIVDTTPHTAYYVVTDNVIIAMSDLLECEVKQVVLDGQDAVIDKVDENDLYVSLQSLNYTDGEHYVTIEVDTTCGRVNATNLLFISNAISPNVRSGPAKGGNLVEILIHGEHIDIDPDYLSVKFGTVEATVLAVNETRIFVFAPFYEESLEDDVQVDLMVDLMYKILVLPNGYTYEKTVACPSRCHASDNRGLCNVLECVCMNGWFGESCDVPECPADGLTNYLDGSGMFSTAQSASYVGRSPTWNCTIAIYPGGSGYEFGSVELDVTECQFAPETVVTFYDSDMVVVKQVVGSAAPFTLFVNSSSISVSVDGASLPDARGLVGTYRGVDLIETPIATVLPEYARVGFDQQIIVTGREICSHLDDASLAERVNVTLCGLKTIINHGSCVDSMGGLFATVIEKFEKMGKCDVVVCSQGLNSCKIGKDAFEIEPELQIIKVVPSSIYHYYKENVTITFNGNLDGCEIISGDFDYVDGAIIATTANSATFEVRLSPMDEAYPGPVDINIQEECGVVSNSNFLTLHKPVTLVPAMGTDKGNTTVTISSPVPLFKDLVSVKFNDKEATVLSATDHELQVSTPAYGSEIGNLTRVNVVIETLSEPNMLFVEEYAYYPVGKPVITNVVPNAGPVNGGTVVTITGMDMNDGTLADVERVVLDGVVVANITSVSPVEIVVVSDHAPKLGDRSVHVFSTLHGESYLNNAYTYYYEPIVTGIEPSSGPVAGGQVVCVKGDHLYTKSNNLVETVKFNDVPAASIVSFNRTRVCVATPAGTAGKVSVVYVAKVHGETKTYACPDYTYLETGIITGVSPAACTMLGGCYVTISGTNLYGVDEEYPVVKIDGVVVPRIISMTGTTKIRVEVPAAGEYVVPGAKVDVTVTSSYYGTAKGTKMFTYVANGGITSITSIYPASCVAIGGCQVKITGTKLSKDNALLSLKIGTYVLTAKTVTETEITFETPKVVGAATGLELVFQSAEYGITKKAAAFSFVENGGEILHFTPTSGAHGGNTRITIQGANLCEMNPAAKHKCDVDWVLVGGVAVKEIASASPTTIDVVTGPLQQAQVSAAVIVHSASRLGAVSKDHYTYHPQGVIGSVSPNEGPKVGGTRVVIKSAAGSALCKDNINDIISVTLADVSAKVLSVQATSIVVETGKSDKALTGNVVIHSREFGETTAVNQWTYKTDKKGGMGGWSIFFIIMAALAGCGAIAGGILFGMKHKRKSEKEDHLLLVDETSKSEYVAFDNDV